MSPVPVTGPVSQPERLEALDVLRGFALLGILVMNIQSFSMPALAYINPNVYGDLNGVNYAVWLAGHLLVDQKMMNIFSMLFGAGLVLMSERLASAPALRRRMVVLLAFGLVHILAFWHGDILAIYAVAGFVVVWFRNWPPERVLAMGIATFALNSEVLLWQGHGIRQLSGGELEEFLALQWMPPARALESELAAFRGGLLSELVARLIIAYYAQVLHNFQNMCILRPIGMMLVGMALYRWGVLSAARPAAFYRRLILWAAGAGLPLAALGVWMNTRSGWSGAYYYWLGQQFNFWAAPLVSLGWIGAVMLVVNSGAVPRLRRPPRCRDRGDGIRAPLRT